MTPWRPERPESYAARTHASPHWIIRYAHQQRFEVARQLVARANPHIILDYGSGDGQFLIGMIQADLLSNDVRILAFEPVPSVAEILRSNLRATACADRVQVVTELDDLSDTRFDYICCMGVLEHLPLASRYVFYAFLDESLASEGAALIDIPVEVGLSVLIKEFGRRILKRDPPDYTMTELFRIVLGGSVFDPTRFDPRESDFISRHRGFDHRLLCLELAKRFLVVNQTPTPLPHLPPWMGNQELLVTVRRTNLPSTHHQALA